MFIKMFYFPSIFPWYFFPSVLTEIIPMGISKNLAGFSTLTLNLSQTVKHFIMKTYRNKSVCSIVMF